MATVALRDVNGDLLEIIEVKSIEDYILYRGRLFVWEDGDYHQKQFLEIY